MNAHDKFLQGMNAAVTGPGYLQKTYRVVVVREDSEGFTGASGVYSTMAEAKAELLDIARTWVGLTAPQIHADGSITVTPDGMPSRTYSILAERKSAS